MRAKYKTFGRGGDVGGCSLEHLGDARYVERRNTASEHTETSFGSVKETLAIRAGTSHRCVAKTTTMTEP